MNPSLKYKILTEIPVIVEYYEGLITLNDLIEFEIREMNDENYSPDLNTITDLRNAKLSALDYEVNEFVNFLKQTKGIVGNRKVAIITNTPDQVAITSLYSMYTKDLPIKNEVFSTIEAAISWLGLPVSLFKLIKDNIDFLEKS